MRRPREQPDSTRPRRVAAHLPPPPLSGRRAFPRRGAGDRYRLRQATGQVEEQRALRTTSRPPRGVTRCSLRRVVCSSAARPTEREIRSFRPSPGGRPSCGAVQGLRSLHSQVVRSVRLPGRARGPAPPSSPGPPATGLVSPLSLPGCVPGRPGVLGSAACRLTSRCSPGRALLRVRDTRQRGS